ncbi:MULTISPECIES: aminoacyl-tRNA hydrolase [Glutamicibacter]|uniref:peptidyl-tRNA hydrolase n=1 Tax=Glutamicibacter creatinolyticus TaxID=162496 RepID=A0A5B7WVR8_9MICC|nr:MULTISPECIES: aminoacyl-tRNA hydrolase [Glutamicibacter]QCY48098.1 Hypothetical protein GcLGCM259_2391 [Glutamicibacter creatinolyticus]TLK52832.1 hypothetical protein FDN03_08350 [Glutamicibacter sp. V16R2B1]
MSEYTERVASELIQPIILLVDKEDPAGEDEAIAAVALASIAAFLQDPVNPAWQPWAHGAFGKSVRRANPKAFAKVRQEFPEHALIEIGGAQAAGLAPVPADDMPKILAKLQVSGTQLPQSGGVLGGQVVIVLDASLEMSTGKASAQAAHALFAWLLEADEDIVQQWIADGATLGVRQLSRDDFTASMELAHGPVIHDAGRTEIEPGSATAYVLLAG